MEKYPGDSTTNRSQIIKFLQTPVCHEKREVIELTASLISSCNLTIRLTEVLTHLPTTLIEGC